MIQVYPPPTNYPLSRSTHKFGSAPERRLTSLSATPGVCRLLRTLPAPILPFRRTVARRTELCHPAAAASPARKDPRRARGAWLRARGRELGSECHLTRP